MNFYKANKRQAHEKLLYIDNYEVDNPENRHKLIDFIMWILKYLFWVGKECNIDFKEDEDIKRLPSIIEKQFDNFAHVFLIYKLKTRIHCYEYLKMRSGLRYLMDSFGKDDPELMKKLEELDSYLVEDTDRLPNVLDMYYDIEKNMDEWCDWIDYEYHFYTDDIVKMRGIPKSHDWWPDFCRKDE
ncbi:hypothetical protein DMUE_4576 [Dictyocoela muelleri]|nr:hypothetical protein DMUE_4576 [Dictyocoela muelleri]